MEVREKEEEEEGHHTIKILCIENFHNGEKDLLPSFEDKSKMQDEQQLLGLQCGLSFPHLAAHQD